MLAGLALALTVLAVLTWLAAPTALVVVVAVATGALAAVVVRPEASPMAPAIAIAEPAPVAAAGLVELIAPLPGAVLLLDRDLNVLAANPAAAQLLGRPIEEMTGQSLIRALRDHDLAQVVREASGEPVTIDHEDHEWRATAVPVPFAPAAVVLTVDDRTELRRAQRARQDLVGNVSHELRTPIAAARALAETLAEGVEETEARERFQGRLVDELARLGAIVERLLSLSRLEGGLDTLAADALDPRQLLETARLRIVPLAERQQVEVVLEPAASSLLPAVLGDRERVLEVLSNLLDNALRVSPEGGQVVLAAFADEPTGVCFEVRDQGPGILPSERERVFERFYTGDRARSGPRRGTGLGLAIARHIVLRQGGRIWVADRHPGATLCFTLPLAERSLAGAAENSSPRP